MTTPGDEACEGELDRLAEAWVALWQAELAGLAADPGVAAAWRQALGLGAAWLTAARPAPGSADEPGPAPPGAAAAGLAPGLLARDPLGSEDAVELRSRIENLERRLAALERGEAGGGADRRKPRRRRPPA